MIQIWGRDNAGKSYYLDGYRGRHMQEQFGQQFLIFLQDLTRKRARIRLMTYDKPTGGMGDSVSRFFRDLCVKNRMQCPPIMEMVRTGNAKDDRCMLASRYWLDGTVQLVKHAPEVNFLVDEMLGIGVTMYDDMRDAAADHFHADMHHSRPEALGFQPGQESLGKPWERYFRNGREQKRGYMEISNKTPLERQMNHEMMRGLRGR